VPRRQPYTPDVSICQRCGAENAEQARFCSDCGVPLEAPGTGTDVRKTVTVVFCDVANSTRLGEGLDPEAHRRVMGRHFEAVRVVLERHGGTVEKFIGDAVMAIFGIPVLHEDDALRAVRAASEMREALAQVNIDLRREWNLEIAIRTGVNTGEVVAGEPGAAQTLVTGDAVVVAKRLEETAAAGEILLGESTYRLVQDAVLAEPCGPISAKGKPAIHASRLLAIVRGAEVTPLRLDSPLVGRDLDLAALEATFEQISRERLCRLITVLGPAGIGKSRLVHELIVSLGDRATVLRGHCLPYGEGITFWPLAEVVRQAAGLTDRDSPEVVRQKLETLVASDEDAALICERVAAAVGRGEAAPTRPEEMFWAVRRVLQAIAHGRPLLVVFDDIQWAEGTFLDLIEYVAGWSTGAPILICCLARPELLELRRSWGLPQPDAATILLDPLSEGETERLIENLLGRLPLDEETKVRIATAAAGNPLFVEELLRMLLDEGLLHREDGGWHAVSDLDRLAIPPTIQALLSARLDRLEPEERAVIQRASVAGQVFWWGAVAELSPEPDRAGVGAHLQSLVRKELIRRADSAFAAEDAFCFGHILLRDAAYGVLPKESRADLHERLARWLEQTTEHQAAEYEEILGYHLEQAVRYRIELAAPGDQTRDLAEKAGQRLASAGRHALARADMSAAANLLDRAVALLPSGPPERRVILCELALALKEAGELTRAEEILRGVISEAALSGDRRAELKARIERAALDLLSHREEGTDQLLATVDEAIPALEELGDDTALAKAWHLIGLARGLWCGRFAIGEAALERALEYAHRANDRRQEAEILAQLGFAAWSGPTPVPEAVLRCEEILEAAGGNPTIEAGALRSLAALEARRGRFDESRRLISQARSTYDELGMRLFSVAVSAFGFGDIEMLAGDHAAAERALRPAYSALEQMGEKGYLSAVAGFLARAIYAQDRFEEAERFASICEEEAALDDIWPQVLFRVTRAKILARRGDCAEAEALGAEAANLASSTDMLDFRAGALLDLAEVRGLCGRPEEATPLIEEALGFFEQKGNVVAAQNVRALLERAVTV
jgi:predicted ATPase/class 3 adenylate cyclase